MKGGPLTPWCEQTKPNNPRDVMCGSTFEGLRALN